MEKITKTATAGAESSTTGEAPSEFVWETLERRTREDIQQFVQRTLEEEVDDLLGRKKSERRTDESALVIETDMGVQGSCRCLKTPPSGTITLKRPRVSDMEEKFASRLLPLFKRRTRAIRRRIGPHQLTEQEEVGR